MNHFSINGIETELPLAPEKPFEDLIKYVRENYASDSVLVSSVLVNGMEMTGKDEAELAQTPVSDIDSLEVLTAHPREVAEETLQSLLQFSEILARLSFRCADDMKATTFHGDFQRLTDGVGTFMDALYGVKHILRIGVLQEVSLLEADVLSILKDMLKCREEKETVYLTELLREHLPRNLEQWKSAGIPAIIRSRDS